MDMLKCFDLVKKEESHIIVNGPSIILWMRDIPLNEPYFYSAESRIGPASMDPKRLTTFKAVCSSDYHLFSDDCSSALMIVLPILIKIT